LYKGKKDFAVELVSEGLAQVSIVGSKIPQSIDELEAAEGKAKADGIGIWSKSLKLASASSPKKIK
jgi:endonuclease YncB( thermonuclease family)